MVITKRQIVRQLLIKSGWARWRWRTLPHGIYCFNFHRIGDADSSPFDRGVFSCSQPRFGSVISQIAKGFRVIALDKMLELFDADRPVLDRYAVITFDDGYHDNFTLAYPLLRAHRIPALFFLPTKFISANECPWWDAVAWCVRHSRNRDILIPGMEEPIAIEVGKEELAIRRILRVFKVATECSLDSLVEHLYDSTGAPRPPVELLQSLFMSWSDAREMSENGMSFGSHTCSHRILARLCPEDQEYELKHSRDVIKAELGTPPLAVSYPVGGKTAFSEVTMRLASEAGYRAGFSFLPGVVSDASTNRFCMPRFAVDEIEDEWSLPLHVLSRGAF